ncbi:MAG: bile acid:sodium symporter family protein [Cycloclasticus sp.]|nr:bile acid:sodium symporter family protein [Cycloclasticus sp.]
MISYLASILLTTLMFGMGLSLTLTDFKLVFKLPKAVLVGITGQLILLPLLGFAMCLALDLTGIVALGIMLLTLCPGGVLSNMFTLIARGDVALSVSMTSISSLITVFSLPFILNLSMLFFNDDSIQLSLPLLKTALQIMLMTVLPVSIGMFVLHRFPTFATRSEKWVRRGCSAFLPMLIIGILLQHEGAWFQYFLQLGVLTVILNLLAILLGYSLAKLAKLDNKRVRTLSIEVGAQNAMLGVTIAISPFLLNNTEVAMIPSIYGITMVVLLWFYASVMNYFDNAQLKKAAIKVNT